MRLGSMPIIQEKREIIKEIGATDIDMSPIEDRLKKIETQQMIIMIALAVIVILMLTKK
jgi:hypothetical protein